MKLFNSIYDIYYIYRLVAGESRCPNFALARSRSADVKAMTSIPTETACLQTAEPTWLRAPVTSNLIKDEAY